MQNSIKNRQSRLLIFFYCISAGLALAIPFLNPWVGILTFFAMVPMLLLTADNSNIKIQLLKSSICWVIFFLITCHWVLLNSNLGDVSIVFGFLLCLVFIPFALFFSLFNCCFRLTKNPFILATVFIILDYIKNTILYFPYASLEHSLYKYIYLIQLTSELSSSSVLWIIVFINVCLYNFIKSGRKLYLLISFIGFLILPISSIYLINEEKEILKSSKTLDVVVVQAGYPQKDKWNPLETNNLIESVNQNIFDINRFKESNNVDLVVLSEALYPLDFSNQASLMGLLSHYLNNSSILLGAVRDLDKQYNSIVFIPKEETLKYTNYSIEGFNNLTINDIVSQDLQYYNKVKLVPFGEHLPLEKSLSGLYKKIYGYRNYNKAFIAPGEKYNTIEYEDLKIGPLICYESGKDDVIKDSLKDINIIVVVSNDSWFRNFIGKRISLSTNVFLAIKTRKYLLKSTQNGISTIIDSTGEIKSEITHEGAGFLYEKVHLKD